MEDEDYKIISTDSTLKKIGNRIANLMSLKSIITLLFDVAYVYMILASITVPNTYEYLLYGINISLFGVNAFELIKEWK